MNENIERSSDTTFQQMHIHGGKIFWSKLLDLK